MHPEHPEHHEHVHEPHVHPEHHQAHHAHAVSPLDKKLTAIVIILILAAFALGFIAGKGASPPPAQPNQSALSSCADTKEQLAALEANLAALRLEIEGAKNRSTDDLGTLKAAARLRAFHSSSEGDALDAFLKAHAKTTLAKARAAANRTLAATDDEYLTGISHFVLGEDNASLPSLSDAISLGNNASNARFLRGAACYRLGNYSAALEDYGAALNGCAENTSDNLSTSLCTDIADGIANSLFQISRYDEAVKWIGMVNTSALEGDPDLMDLKAEIYLRNGLCNESMAAYDDLFYLLSYNVNEPRVKSGFGKYCTCESALGMLQNDSCIIRDRLRNMSIIGKRT